MHCRPKAIRSASSSRAKRRTRIDGASHSGLVSALYLARASSRAGRAFFVQGGQGLFVEADQQFGRGRRRQHLVEEDAQGGVRHRFEAQGRLAHLADAAAQGGGVLGAQVAVV
jgi:hypothetical protein